jgi:hypothetical protein
MIKKCSGMSSDVKTMWLGLLLDTSGNHHAGWNSSMQCSLTWWLFLYKMKPSNRIISSALLQPLFYVFPIEQNNVFT